MTTDDPQTGSPEDPQPTEVLPAVDPATAQMPSEVPPAREDVAPAVTATGEPRSPYKLAVWILGALVVILLISVIAALATRGGDPAPAVSATTSPSVTPTASESPSPSPSPSPSVTPTPSEEPPPPAETTEAPPPPPPPGPKFSSFSAPSSVQCADEYSNAEVTLQWASSNATQAWVGIATDNAKIQPYSDVPTSGTITLPFPCSNASQLYTVTLQDADGVLNHRSITVNRNLG